MALRDALRAQVAARRQGPAAGPPPYGAWLHGAVPRSWDAGADHIRLIAEHLDAVTAGQIDRLAIFMPPRHGKSETVTVRYPVYRLQTDPSASILLTASTQRLAERFNRKTRSIAAGYCAIDATKRAADEWYTTAGGQVLARGVGSPPVGIGFGLIVIDDPIRRREDAESEAYRERAWDWYTDDLYTRLEPGGAIIMVLTRWHEDDVASRAIASEPGRWTILSLPALAEEGDALNRAPGAPLWPARFGAEALTRIRDVMTGTEGLRSWEALYQQRPTAAAGAMFQPAKIEVHDAAPALVRRVRAWDFGATEAGGDYTVGVLMGIDEHRCCWVLDVRRGQWGPDQVDAEVRQTAAMDGHDVEILGPQDPGAAGVKAAQAFVRGLAGYQVRVERPTGPKETRARGLAAQVNAGNLRMLRAEWNRDLVEELRQFPRGQHDDQVDACADAFNELTAWDSTVIEGFW